MKGCLRAVAILVILAAVGIYAVIPHPSYHPTKLKAIAAESRLLMARHPIKPPEEWASVEQGEFPPVIASLRPYMVTVYDWGVHIGTTPYFDGGWGYAVPRTEKDRKMLTEWCYSEVGHGVLWHGPC